MDCVPQQSPFWTFECLPTSSSLPSEVRKAPCPRICVLAHELSRRAPGDVGCLQHPAPCLARSLCTESKLKKAKLQTPVSLADSSPKGLLVVTQKQPHGLSSPKKTTQRRKFTWDDQRSRVPFFDYPKADFQVGSFPQKGNFWVSVYPRSRSGTLQRRRQPPRTRGGITSTGKTTPGPWRTAPSLACRRRTNFRKFGLRARGLWVFFPGFGRLQKGQMLIFVPLPFFCGLWGCVLLVWCL